MTDILIPSNKVNIVTDATLLTSIMKCGRYTDLKFNHNLQPIKGKSNSLEIGSVIHKFMEVYYGSQMKGIGKSQAFGFGISAAELYIQGCKDCTKFESIAPLNIPCNCAAFNTPNAKVDDSSLHGSDCFYIYGRNKPSCGHPPNEYPGLHNTPSESEGYNIGWKFALQTCDEYHKFWASDFWVTVDVETVRSKTLYEDDEIRILWKSKLDWIVDTNQGIFPCDHKTMKQNRDSISINNQFMGQCRMMDTRNIFINKVGLQKTLKPVDKFKRESISYSSARLMEWQSYILPYWCKQLIAYNEQGHYPPNFHSCDGKYGKCEFYEGCESDPDMREEVFRLNFYRGSEWNPTNQINDE